MRGSSGAVAEDAKYIYIKVVGKEPVAVAFSHQNVVHKVC